jgi:hypothetical protein
METRTESASILRDARLRRAPQDDVEFILRPLLQAMMAYG